jgi:ATP adenylyltransferase
MIFIEKHAKDDNACVFCKMRQQTCDEANLIVFRGRNAFTVLNRFPYTSGHLLIVANAHKPSLENLGIEVRNEMMELATEALRILRGVYHPDAFNIGANIGKSAGAGIEGHIHLHVVPRWTGDANFMTTVAETKVIPEALDETYRRICSKWK